MTKLLFVHPNFPGQFRGLAPGLSRLGYEVAGLGKFGSVLSETTGMSVLTYKGAPFRVQTTRFAPLEDFADSVRQGRSVANRCRQLRAEGYVPDVIIGHPGWGDMMFLDQIWPDARQIAYLEFYYRHDGADAYFDPEFKPRPAEREYASLRNLNQLLAFERAAVCVTPTEWQKSLFPSPIRDRLDVIHEGVDSRRVAPDPKAKLKLPDGSVLDRSRQVLTYVARNLEPYRGFHVFMRALPEIQRRNPDLFTVIVGGNDVSYGRKPESGNDWKTEMLVELGQRVDHARIWFAGKLAYDSYLKVLQVSTVHLYLTYPFVLSWSLVEAMAAGCAIVASDTAPVRELLEDAVNAQLVPFLDTAAIASAVGQLLAQGQQRKKFAAAARGNVVADFDLETTTIPAYRRLIER